MSLAVAQLTVTHGTTNQTAVNLRCNLGEPYIRWISVRTNAPTNLLWFRLTNNSQLIAPVPGIGLQSWLLMLASVDWDEFRKLVGPNYEIMIEAYNTDGATDYILQVIFETSKMPYYPVNVLADPSASIEKQPAPKTSGV
jgi:hypothetical protein